MAKTKKKIPQNTPTKKKCLSRREERYLHQTPFMKSISKEVGVQFILFWQDMG